MLDREPGDPQILDRVTRALLASDAKRYLRAGAQIREALRRTGDRLRKQPPPGHFGKADWMMEVDRGVARAIVLEARATGNLGKLEEALALAQKELRRSFRPRRAPEKSRDG